MCLPRTTFASACASGGVRRRSASRYVQMMSIDAARSARTRRWRSSNEERSAQCRSSSTRTKGWLWAEPRRNRLAASSSRKRACSESPDCTAYPRACGSCASSGRRAARSVACGICAAPVGSVPRACARSSCTHGQYAGAPPPSQHRPQRTRAPRALASDAISSASRVLPMPGSPAMMNTRPWPARASSKPSRSCASSNSRPTNGLGSVRGGCSEGRSMLAPLALISQWDG